MCGIAGWFDNEIDMSKQIPVLYKMSQTLSKRGPDENGLYINKGCALLHRRLIVIDKEKRQTAYGGTTQRKNIYNHL